MLLRSTIQLLRFHFSFFLLPVFLFAISLVPSINLVHAALAFVILHLLVYPASNGYNSYMDRDTSPIGGLARPLQPTKQLFTVTILMDAAAVLLSFFISIYFATGIILYIIASRSYSYRGIRLKKYPIAGYLVVIIFQGALVFFLSYHGSSANKDLQIPFWGLIAATCLIGGSYPLTQVYQHDEDRKDGIITISYLLGIRGTFIFSSILFGLATFAIFLLYYKNNNVIAFYFFLLCLFPMVWFFIKWIRNVWKDERNADFRSSMIMNVLSASCTSVYFLFIIIYKNR